MHYQSKVIRPISQRGKRKNHHLGHSHASWITAKRVSLIKRGACPEKQIKEKYLLPFLRPN